MPGYYVSLSVVTYNSERYIGEMLDSIINNVHGTAYHIYVVDNGSTDNTISIVKSRECPCITLIENTENLGFGRGHNQVLDKLNSKYHICINPDVVIKNDVVTDIARYLDVHEDIGILTPKVLYPDGRLQVLPKRDPKLIYLLARRINLPFLRKYREEFEMQDKDADSAFDIEFCTGSFMFMRAELLKKAGGFDERYFMYFEDADLTRTIRRFARTEYNPAYIVYHHWERAGGRQLKYLLIQVASMLKYMRKWRKAV